MLFKVSQPSAEHIRSLTSRLGAVLTGRRTFEVAQGWGGNHFWGPAFVLTHTIPAGWPRPNSNVHFVTEGIETAVRQAKIAANGKAVGVHGAEAVKGPLWQQTGVGDLGQRFLPLQSTGERLPSTSQRAVASRAMAPYLDWIGYQCP